MVLSLLDEKRRSESGGQQQQEAIYEVTGGRLSSGKGFFLCCVCQEQNTTYRYEVLYKENNNNVSILNQSLTCSPTKVGENDYYNFPLRHPRHGHLKWDLAALNAKLYPDYPVHIPTFTLKRSSLKKGMEQLRAICRNTKI